MIAENPLYKELFYMGYTGRENTYEYFTEKEEAILNEVRLKKPQILADPKVLIEFRAKLRWKSQIGLLFLYEITRRVNTSDEPFDFRDISIDYGKGKMSINEFLDLYPLPQDDISKSKFDLRGLSLVRVDLKTQHFHNIDLRYSTFCNIRLTSATFKECSLDHASMIRSEFINTVFDKWCTLDSVDFSDSLLDATFKCKVTTPQISYLSKRDLKFIIMGFNARWRAFTEIPGDTFIDMCDKQNLKEYVAEQQKRVAKAYNIRQGGLLRRIAECVWTTF